jgi:thiol:disulfide interchange protein DsbD
MIFQYILDYFSVFAAGVAVSFTPCVYPVIPIVVSVVGRANVHGTKLAGFVLSCVYVLGIAISYSLLGIVAVLTGQFFGHLQDNPYMFFGVAVFFIFFSLIMADIVSMPILSLGIQGRIRPKNAIGIFLIGFMSGFVVGPCTAPILGSILLYVAAKKNLVHAISLLFVFAYGVGFSLILVGTFSGLLTRLPKPGKWLARVKQIFAGILLLTGIFFFAKAIMLLNIF